jgi:hypothetical protein
VLQSYRKISQTPIPEPKVQNYFICVSVMGEDDLDRSPEEAQIILNEALAAPPQQPGIPSTTNLKEKP